MTKRRSFADVRSPSSTLMMVTTLCSLLATVQLVAIKTEAKLNPVLNINETYPYLMDGKTGKIIQPRDYMEFDNIYSPNDTYRAQQTVQGRNYHLLKAFDFANYFQADYWHYSSEEDLKQSALPVANEFECGQQLNWLEQQIVNSSGTHLFKPGEQHVHLASLVDSFGRPEANTYLGHGYWLGSYYECNRISIDLDKYRAEECANNTSNDDKNCTNPSTTTTTAMKPIMKTRYCIGKAREFDWPEDNYVPRISYKVGLCLPETCQTLSISKHKHQIERLMRFNLPEYLRSRIILDDMYCLPDKRSPIRALSLSAKVFLALIGAWLAALLVATSLYSCLRRHQKDLRHLERQMRTVDLTAPSARLPADHQQSLATTTTTTTTTTTNDDGHTCDQHLKLSIDTASSEEPPADEPEQQKSNLVNYILHQAEQHGASMILSKSAPASPSLLIIRNRQSLVEPSSQNECPTIDSSAQEKQQLENLPEDPRYTHDSQSESSYNSSSSSLSAWLTGSPVLIRALQALSITENVREFQEPPKMLRDPQASQRLRINLNALDAIKCLCCVLVIFGHIVFIHMQHLDVIVHTIELSNEVAPRVLIAFFNFVDTFFIISGMLTAYFIFKRFNKRSFASPLIWLSISLLRLIRLSPVYLLVFWFVKTLSVHLSDGPIWDYGTDKNSIRGLCQNDHWWKSLLYLGNVGTMQPLCILPAWSIILDAQYSLFVPPVLFLIFRHKRIGYLSLLVAIVISTGSMSYQLATQTAVKTSDMSKIRLHVYPLISRFAAEFYNTAWNRLGPVAVGILGGHMLYLYDIGHIRHWPYFMRGAYFKFILMLHVLIFLLPTIGRFTDNPEAPAPLVKTPTAATGTEPDLMLFVLSNATIKPVWSIINTIFLLRLITDLRLHSLMARLMSHNVWHCLGKLCFASYLVHYEIILILCKSRQDGLMDPNWWNIGREFSAAFLISTLVAYLIYILFEAPVNKLFMLNVDKSNLVKNQKLSNQPAIDAAADDDDASRHDINCPPSPSSSSGYNTPNKRNSLAASTSSINNHHHHNYLYECIDQKRPATEKDGLACMA